MTSGSTTPSSVSTSWEPFLMTFAISPSMSALP